MTAKHTPGPWRLHKRFTFNVEGPDGRTIARVNWDDETYDEAIANANLIAAAPDLLAAVKEAVEIIQDFADSLCGCGYVDSPCRVCYAAAKFKDVIAKACGEG